MDPITVSTADAARMLGIGKTKLFRLISEGEIDTVRLGGQRLIKVASLHDLINRSSHHAVAG